MQKSMSFLVAASCAVLILATGQLWADNEVPEKATVIELEDSQTSVATWPDKDGHHYAINSGDETWHHVNQTSYDLQLRYGQFDPLVGVPTMPDHLRINELETGDNVFIVQFVTQPLEEYRRNIRALGGTIYKYMAHHAYLVRLNPEARFAVSQLPYVRWVGMYEPAYKFESTLIAGLQADVPNLPATRVNIMVMERGLDHKTLVAAQIAAVGGKLDALTPNGFRIEATLNGAQLVDIASMPEVMWIDLWSEKEVDMNIAREIGGANQVETVAGFDGQGVRGEVMDSNLFSVHVDFQAMPPLFHGSHAGGDDHGTGTYGIVFGDGTGDSTARGMMSSAQGIFADFDFLSDRYQHTAALGQSPYFAVFQSNSWGNARTRQYNSITAEMDDILFINDILITQSQSNANNQDSRPQAWAKNIVSVGGVNHQNTLTKNDDFWSGASIGPANDGRVKPDLLHFYDATRTTDDTQNGYRNFGGTSGATPIVAGYFGLLAQMWSEGIFGNEIDINGTVFENRSHASTAKAMMINLASSYPFNGTNHNLTRTHQGWGMPDLTNIYDARDSIFVVDEDVVIANLETATFELEVENGAPEFRATLVYVDPMGTTSSNQHRINDLTLKVTSPGGTVFWGNNGLLTGNWSTSGGSANTINTVENVFVQSPAVGTWTVEVIASEINEDSHVETGAVDADFALVVSGVNPNNDPTTTPESFTVDIGSVDAGGLPELIESDDQHVVLDPEFLSFRYQLVFTVAATSPSSTPSALEFSYESRAFNLVGTVEQTIELFNYDAGQFESLDTRLTSATDAVVTVSPGGDLSRFVQSGTDAMQARISYQNSLPFWVFNTQNLYLPYRVRADQVFWTVTP